MTQPELPLFRRHFAGPEYKTTADHDRLNSQHARVKALMEDGKWRTLDEISFATGDPVASVSAQLRHLRKDGFGNHKIGRLPVGDRDRGLFQYAMLDIPQKWEYYKWLREEAKKYGLLSRHGKETMVKIETFTRGGQS